jgi:hypothetical protein
MTWATPSHAATSPLPRAANSVEMGPGPLRTARGAGRDRFDADLPFDEDFLPLAWLPDDRLLEDAVLLLLDDAGGEDVRVAMVQEST